MNAVRGAILMLVAIAVAVLLLAWFQSAAPIPEAAPRVALSGRVAFDELFDGITPERIRRTHDHIVAVPSRLAGLEGDLEASRYVEQQLRELDLEVHIQHFPVTVPVTTWCRLTIVEETHVAGDAPPITLHPFWPNHVRTCTTPPEGLVGKVIDVGTGSLEELNGKDVKERIVLADMAAGYQWLDAAKLGAAAILFRPTDEAAHYAAKVLQFPGNIPRFLVTGPVDRLVGRTVRIEARVDWEVRQARNVVGVLRPQTPSREALYLLSYTDSWSVVPDLAPGSYEACSATALVETARALAGQREGLARTVIFVAGSGRSLGIVGPRRLHDAVGLRGAFAANYALIEQRVRRAETELYAMRSAVEALGQVDYWGLNRSDEPRLWRRFGRRAKEACTSIAHDLIDRYVSTAADRAAAAKLAWEQAGRPEKGPTMVAQLQAARVVRRAQQATGADAVALKEHFKDVLEASGCRARMSTALEDALGAVEDELRVEQDTLRLADLLRPFEKTYFVMLAPSTHGRRMRYEASPELGRHLERARDAVVSKWIEWRPGESSAGAPHPSHHLIDAVSTTGAWSTDVRNRAFPVQKIGRNEQTHFFYQYAHALHAPVVLAGIDLPESYHTPLDTQVSFEDLAAQAQMIAGLSAQIAAGDQSIQVAGQTAWTQRKWFSDFGGSVVTLGGANAILPTRRAADTLVVVRGQYGRHVHMHRSRDGTFRFPAVERGPDTLIADAYRIEDRTGQIVAARDMGLEGARFPHTVSEARHYAEPQTRVTLLLTRMAPTDVFRLIGPDDQPVTLEVLDADFHGPMNVFSVAHEWEHGATVFGPPGSRFYLRLKGYPHYRSYTNESTYRFDAQGLLAGRGIMMGRWGAPGADQEAAEPRETPGPARGYVSGLQDRILFQEADLAISLAQINRDHLRRQEAHGLADAVSLSLADQADDLIESAQASLSRKQYTKAYRDLMRSTSLSLRTYPHARHAVADALGGILLYMCLLVPFSLFAERLLIGAGDVRARIAGTFGIFLAAFLAVRLAHPAYELLSSPLIVLVGFVIFMLCLLILLFISGRFAERVATLRRARAGATESEVDISRTAAAAAAFSLGFNNMRKGKVRTAFTVATLIVVSFCLICFTASHPRLMRRDLVIGPAPADGIVLRFDRQRAGHPGSVRTRYGDRARILARRSMSLTWSATYVPPSSGPRHTWLIGALWVQADEAELTGIDRLLLPGGQWFERDDEAVCYISDVTAGTLGIDPSRLARGEQIEILLSGWPIRVAGIFDASALDAWLDLDHESNLPETESRFTLRHRQLEKARRAAGRPGGGRTSASLTSGSQMIILPLNTAEEPLCTSFALLFDDLPHGEAHRIITDFMDTSVTFVGYALDGLAFFGGKFRDAGLETLVDVVVPLCIAAIIVFNTMLGSVYERRQEISVYSAVGLSPRHVFFLFLAESLVYAVVGVVGGYLVALALQWAGHASGSSLGLQINYSSRSAVYVAVTLMAAVIVSSLLPARRAARIASPSEGASWTVPEPVGPGMLEFDLPFTFVGRDVLAVVPFLTGWFDARGEDASGEFSASPPRVEVVHESTRDAPLFIVESTAWLRPYDLGVSQRVRVSIKPTDDQEAGPFHTVSVRVDRLGGDETSWRRTNVRFVGLLRRHLLAWRALPGGRRATLLEQGRKMLGIPLLRTAQGWSQR